MPDNDPSESLLLRLCELQEKQLDALQKLSEHLSVIAVEARKNHDAYADRLTSNEQKRKQQQKAGLITGSLVIGMLAFIAIAILVAHYF